MITWLSKKKPTNKHSRGEWTGIIIRDRVEIRTCFRGCGLVIKIVDRRLSEYYRKRPHWYTEGNHQITLGTNGSFCITPKQFVDLYIVVDEGINKLNKQVGRLQPGVAP